MPTDWLWGYAGAEPVGREVGLTDLGVRGESGGRLRVSWDGFRLSSALDDADLPGVYALIDPWWLAQMRLRTGPTPGELGLGGLAGSLELTPLMSRHAELAADAWVTGVSADRMGRGGLIASTTQRDWSLLGGLAGSLSDDRESGGASNAQSGTAYNHYSAVARGRAETDWGAWSLGYLGSRWEGTATGGGAGSPLAAATLHLATLQWQPPDTRLQLGLAYQRHTQVLHGGERRSQRVGAIAASANDVH
jgi:hypothetical protein